MVYLSNPGDGAQVPSDLEESRRRWRRMIAQAGCAALIHNEGFRFKKTEQMWGFFTLRHSDLKPYEANWFLTYQLKKVEDNYLSQDNLKCFWSTRPFSVCVCVHV